MLIVTIPFSHYNERARWALLHHGQVAHERRYLPMLHIMGVNRVTRPEDRKPDSTGGPSSTPVLVLDDGRVVPTSTEILHWVDATHGTPETTLYPEAHREAIEAFEQRIHDRLGKDTRFLAYWFMLNDAAAFSTLVRENVSWSQRASFAVGAPLAKAGMRKRFGLTQARYEKIRARTEEEIAALGELLGEGTYFFGDRFTAADLTCAALLSAAIAPLPNYGAKLPRVEGGYGQMRDSLLETPVGRHAVRMFEQHRPPTPATWTVE
ncbi:MAG: glutathione S-transferase family protein [Myxococcota bacterium]